MAGGALTVGVGVVLAFVSGIGPLYAILPLTLLLAFSWAFPVLVLRTEETEAFQLDEPFFVAMALLLPPAGTILVFALAIAIGNAIRRRPLVRAAFNTGQTVTSTGLGLLAMHALAPIHQGDPSVVALGAAVVGAAVFLFANSAAVSLVISFAEGKSAKTVFLDGLDLRVLVWAGGSALGLLVAVGASTHSWALALGALPLAALNLVLSEHARARRETARTEALLVAASRIHDAVAQDDVDAAVAAAAMDVLRCRRARIDTQPPGIGELGVEVSAPDGARWLVASDPIGFDPFGATERRTIEALAGMAASALQNARLLEQIRYRAIHDPLTGLPNKVLFTDRLAQALVKRTRFGQPLAVMFLDLDQFKIVNDSLGHDVGDQVLMAAAERLQEALRSGDTAARLGGDEFAILCEQLSSPENAAAMAERLRSVTSRPLVVNEVELVLTASVGLVIVEPWSTVTAEAVLQSADTAVYKAKERGRDRVEVFDDELRNRALSRLETETTLRRALDDGRLRVFYQPILDPTGTRVLEAEALLRIETPSGTLLSPDNFIEVAEASGLIATIGVGVLEEACRQAVKWEEEFGDAAPRRIAVNLSGRQLSRVPVAETVGNVLADTGCSAQRLALEITETVLTEAGEDVLEELRTLRKMGVTIGLDDFGTGYSSLAYLKRFPVDFVKIDRCFVSGLGQDAGDEAIVTAVITLAHSLGLSTVAEGVETREQMERLRELGCDRLQGYLFARPRPAVELEHLLIHH